MNLLEHHIEKILSIKDHIIEGEWAKKYEFKKVKMIVNSCGVISEVERVFTKEEWELVYKNGYYLA